MSCQPDKVTALVDGALPPGEVAALQAHLAQCVPCHAQAEAERTIHRRLHELPQPELPPGLETRLRAQLRAASARPPLPRRLLPWALPAAALLVLGLWLRGLPAVVAWEMANDHGHCFSYREPPASVRSTDPATVTGWFAGQGTPMPRVPAEAGAGRIFGARYCYFPDVSAAPHVYYVGASHPLSVFVLSHDARFDGEYRTREGQRNVTLVRLDGMVVGVVGEDAADVESTVLRLRTDANTRQALLSLLRRVPDR